MTSPSSMCETGHSSWCTRTTQRDGVGREEGGEGQDGGHMYTRGGVMLMYGKNHSIVK